MNRQYIAVFSLIIFLQAVLYPAAVFALYAETGNTELGSQTSLPADLPDNGDAFYFGYTNSEEEQAQQHGLQTDDFNVRLPEYISVVDATVLSCSVNSHGVLHPENSTPPPEQK